jgi:hypothetical protein
MKRAAERGQAMVEATVMFGVVVMMFLGIWYLAKFHDVQASTIQAARYSAWERTVHSPGAMSDTTVQNQARARLFTWNSNAFTNTDGLRNGQAWTTQSAVWRDHAGIERLIERPDDVVIGTTSGPVPGRAASHTSSAMSDVTGLMTSLSAGERLPLGGVATGNVTVKLNNLARLPAPLDRLDLTLRESSTLMLDAWDASGPNQTALRTRPFTVAGPLTRIDGLMGPIRWALSWIEPAFADFNMGQVCADIMPADRVVNGSNLPAYRGGGSCVR